jgi:hypothetical protein
LARLNFPADERGDVMKKIISYIKSNQYIIQFDRVVSHRFAIFGFILILYILQFIPWMGIRNVAESIIYFILLIVGLKKFAGFMRKKNEDQEE